MKFRALITAASTLALAVTVVPAASANAAATGSGRTIPAQVLRDAAPAARPPLISPRVTPDASSDPWAGYGSIADTNVELRYVASNFTVPTLHCTSATTYAFFWVGLDGWSNGTVEQVGVYSYCYGSTAYYYGFSEMYPDGPDLVSTVSPGNSISVSVYDDSGTYELLFDDKSDTSSSFETYAECPSGHTCENASAEVIVEAPGATGLSDFKSVSFSDTAVTSRDGTHGTLDANSLWSSAEADIEASNGHELAYPSSLSDGGEDFGVTFKQSS